MNYSLVDVIGMCLAVLIYVPLLLAPGVALTRLFRPFDDRQGSPAVTSSAMRLGASLAVGLGLLPLIDSLATRTLGLDGAIGLNLALAVAALVLVLRGEQRIAITWPIAIALLVWLLLILAEWIDFDIGGGLYRPLMIVDLVKHAATVQAIHDTGAPPTDPFFARPGRVSYYYFFYTLPASAERLGQGWISARAAVGGLAFWSGVGAFSLCRLALGRSGVMKDGPTPRSGWILLAVMGAGGLDILAMLRRRLTEGLWLPNPNGWNEQTSGWLTVALWVPHHLCALIAGALGLMALAETERMEIRDRMRAAIFAGLCFAAMLGMSVWVALGAVATVMLWLATLAAARRGRLASAVLLSGAVALVAALPFLLDLKAGRAPGPFPVSLTVRAFSSVDTLVPQPGALQDILRLLFLPLNLAVEMGVLAAGAVLFWMQRRGQPPASETGRVLGLAAIAGLVVGCFFKSNIFNNDLGWRVMLLPNLAFTLWTTAYLETRWSQAGARTLAQRVKAVPATVVVMAVLGYGTSIYLFVGMRAYPMLTVPPSMRFLSEDAPGQREQRAAYEWAAKHLPRTAILQHSVARPRALNFGLYGRNWPAVSDNYGVLFGAGNTAVTMRLNQVFPIFETNCPISEVYARARRLGVDDLIVTADDPAWTQHADWVWRARPIYATARVRIIPVAALEGGA